MTTTPTLDQLKRGLAISEQIAALETELAALFNGSVPAPAAQTTSGRGQFKRSAATIAKMKAAQQARWAKMKGEKTPVAAKTPAGPKAPAKSNDETPVKKKRTMSPEAKAKIGEAMKARWAKTKGTKTPAVSKAPATAEAETPAKKSKKSPEIVEAITQRWTYSKAAK